MSRVGSDLKNPQTIYLDTTFVTSFLYESGTDEMTIILKCIKEDWQGNIENIPFELEDLTATAYYLGQSRELGSVLGSIENGGGWRNGQMVQFVTQAGVENNTPQMDASNRYHMRFENPVLNDLLINRGVMWKRHGGVENGGPVEHIDWHIKANTGNYNIKGGDKISFEIYGNMTQTGQGLNRKTKFYPQGYSGDSYLPTNFSVIGADDSAIGDNSGSAPFWQFTGSGEQDYIEMASPNFNEAYGSAWYQGYLPYNPGPSYIYE